MSSGVGDVGIGGDTQKGWAGEECDEDVTSAASYSDCARAVSATAENEWYSPLCLVLSTYDHLRLVVIRAQFVH